MAAHFQVVDNERAYSLLTGLRRDLTYVHEYMAETSSALASLQLDAHRGQEPPAQHISMPSDDSLSSPGDGIAPTASPAIGSREQKIADLSKLTGTFSELDSKLRVVIAALNDEIQIVIGSVQIQDAKAMKRQADWTMKLTESTVRQTEVSIRQTGWTVALAILAALYLPMILVTGIYGMNIREISGDKGPNWWWVVVTWAVTMGITVGFMGRYALAEWRWYQEIQATDVVAKGAPPEDVPHDKDHGMVEFTSRDAEYMGGVPTLRHLVWKDPPNAQHNSTTRSIV